MRTFDYVSGCIVVFLVSGPIRSNLIVMILQVECEILRLYKNDVGCLLLMYSLRLILFLCFVWVFNCVQVLWFETFHIWNCNNVYVCVCVRSVEFRLFIVIVWFIYEFNDINLIHFYTWNVQTWCYPELNCNKHYLKSMIKMGQTPKWDKWEACYGFSSPCSLTT